MSIGAITPITRWQIMKNGQPAAGAKLYTYLSGSSTPHPVYTTSALNVTRSNPVEADADGILPIIYLDAVAYRFFITDSTGATIFANQDNVYDFAQVQLAGSGGSALIGFIQAGSGAVARTAQSKMREWVSVTDFGALGDGATDDTSAFANAVAAGVKCVLVPPGTYVLTGIDLSSKTDVYLQGDGVGVSTLKLKANTAAAIVTLGESSARITLRDLTLDGNRTNQTPSGDGTHYGVLLAGDTVALENVYIQNCATDGLILNSTDAVGGYSLINVTTTNCRRNGFSVVQGVNCSAVSCAFNSTTGTAPGSGLDIEPSGAQTVRNISFVNCLFQGNAGDGATIGLLTSLSSSIRGIRFVGCIARTNTGRGFRVLEFDTADVSFAGCQAIENAKAGFLTDCDHTQYNNCQAFDNDSAASDTAGIVVGADYVLVESSVSRNKDTTNQAYGILVTGAGGNVTLIGNDVQNNVTAGISDSGASTIRMLNPGDGTQLKRLLYATTTWDPNSMNDGDATGTSVTVTGAVVGDMCLADLDSLTALNVTISAHVVAADTVRVVLVNHTGGVLDVGSGTLKISVLKF